MYLARINLHPPLCKVADREPVETPKQISS
jgi:hypothetical protein